MNGVGVVTIVHGRHEHLRRQVDSLALGAHSPDLHIVVAIDDEEIDQVLGMSPERVAVLHVPTHPDGLPLAAARNRGFAAAIDRGCDVVIGLDVDCLAGCDLVTGYADVVRVLPHVVWSGPVTYLAPAGEEGYPMGDLTALDAPHPGRPAPAPGEWTTGGDPNLFWSLSFALSAQAWQRIGGFDEAYVGYGAEDTDFAHRTCRAELDLGWVGSARAYHQHHPVTSPPVEHLDDILRNGRLFFDRWGTWPMRGWLTAFEELGLIRAELGGWERVEETTLKTNASVLEG